MYINIKCFPDARERNCAIAHAHALRQLSCAYQLQRYASTAKNNTNTHTHARRGSISREILIANERQRAAIIIVIEGTRALARLHSERASFTINNASRRAYNRRGACSTLRSTNTSGRNVIARRESKRTTQKQWHVLGLVMMRDC